MISDSSIPRDLRQLRACLVCSMIKSFQMFEDQGCDNCEHLLGLRGDGDKVDQCTRFVCFNDRHRFNFSANFDGMIALAEPDDSWVGRWQVNAQNMNM